MLGSDRVGQEQTRCGSSHPTIASLYVKAADWELYDGKNPSAGVKKFPKHSRGRFVQSHEIPWLVKALADEMPQIETFFLCLLLTGPRRTPSSCPRNP